MKRNEFRELVDREMSGLQWDERKSRRVLDALDRQEAPRQSSVPMPRKLSLALVLAILSLLVATAALAVALINYSPRVSAENLARQTLMDKYGLTRETLGLFRVSAEERDGETVVTFLDIPSGRTDVNPLTGVYTVTVRRGRATATWSHDDADRALWMSGDLASPVWGQPQLEVYLLRTYEAWPYIMDAMGPNESVSLPDEYRWYSREHEYYTGRDWLWPIDAQEGDLTQEQARALALEAVRDSFSMTEEDFTRFAYHETDLWRQEDGRRIWMVSMWAQPGGVDMSFSVRLDARTGEVLALDVETGGNG